jgi:hypothetical protein
LCRDQFARTERNRESGDAADQRRRQAAS